MVEVEAQIGWKRIEFRAKSAGGVVDKHEMVQGGFGLRILKGAQYVKSMTFLLNNGPVVTLDDQRTWFDGWLKSCPGGFDRVVFEFADDVVVNAVQAVNRVLVEVATVPSVLSVEQDGLASLSAVTIFDSILNADPGDSTEHTIAPLGNLTIVNVNPYQADQSNPGTIKQSRTIGDAQFPWWPTAALFFAGAIVGTAPFRVWLYQHVLTGNGTVETSPIYLWDTVEDLSGGPVPDGGFNQAIILRAANALGGVPVPINGFQMAIDNELGTPVTIKGTVSAASA